MSRQVTQCPVCDAPLRITELSCSQCDTKLHGDFPPAPLARLTGEQQRFIETFVRSRGIIRDVERALGVSYPTVRARLDGVVAALEIVLAERADVSPTPSPERDDRESRRRALLRQVEAGTLTASDAADALRNLL